MRSVTLIIAAAMVASACSDAPSRMTSPTPQTINLHPYRTIIGSDGNPAPGGSDRLLVDTRTSMQQASSLGAAWALFPGNDHSPSSASGGTGWAFTTNFDGAGTHALRADWEADPSCSGATVRIIDYLPTPKPKQLFVQWRQYLGKNPNDAGGLGAANAFRVTNPSCPSNGREELRVLRAGVGGGATNQITHQWAPATSSIAEPSIVTSTGEIDGTQGWSFAPEQNTGRPVTITVYLQAESASGAKDGIIQVWIDGRLFISAANQALGTNGFDRFELPSMFAGAPQKESEYFWNVVAWQPAAGGTSSVTVTPASATINAGATVQLTATTRDASSSLIAGQPVSWSSANTAIATVDGDGLVKGVAAGTVRITATSNGATGSSNITVSSATPPPTALGCSNPQPGWLWCDDFESDHSSSYFEYTNPGGSFVRLAGAGLNGSTGMRATWTAGQVDAGSLKLAFGRTPSSYMRPVDAGTANYREIYWRVYVRSQPGWKPNGNDKFSRAIVFAKSDWSEAAIGQVWGGSGSTSQNYYVLDPVRGTDASGNLVTSGYNDFAHFTWLGAVQGNAPVLGSGAGQWYCVEAHMRLNDAGQSNGVFETWINGTQDAQATGLNFLGSYNAYGINALFLENYINNGAPQAQVRDYDDYVVSTQRVGCESSSPPPPPPALVASVSVSLASSSLAPGGSTQATATLKDSAGNVLTGRSITWTSSNTSVATASASGASTATVSAVAAGTANIVATSGGVSGQATLTVTSAPPPTAASVTVSPSSLSLTAGSSGPLTVTVRDASGNVISRPVTWSSSNTGVATLSGTSNSGATVNGVAQGTATVTATADGVSGKSSITVNAAPPPPPPPPGIPAPGPGATIIQDLRAALQNATTIDQAFAIFGTVDHTPYRGARNTSGWSFTTNADGNGLHALRADWEASTSTDQGIRVIDYLPGPKPREMYVQWKARVAGFPFDKDANGTANSYATYPQSDACKRALFSMTDNSRWDYTLQRSSPEVPRLENGASNFSIDGDPNVWNFNSEVAAAPYVTTVHITAPSTPGGSDGAYQLYINSTLVFDLHNLTMSSTTWDRWEFPATCTVVPQPQADYFWDFLIWKP